MANRGQQLTDTPTYLQKRWAGYFHKKDETLQPSNSLAAGSFNCLIPDEDLIVPRAGSKVIGAVADVNYGIKGNKKKFTNASGDDLEIRVVTDGSLDEIEVLYNDPTTDDPTWYKVNDTSNPMPFGLHRYYFDEWFDTNLDPSQSFNLTRLIFTNGTDSVMSWTGSIAVIGVVTPTTLSTEGGETWVSLGFQPVANGGSGKIVVNQTLYTISSGWETDTITVASTAGISTGDIAFDEIRIDEIENVVDYVSVNKNYAHYGTFNSKNVFVSNAFNRPSTMVIVNAQAIQNDLILSNNASYSGTGSHIYRVTIDSISPAIDINEQTYTGTGPNDGSFDGSGYSGDDDKHVYKITVVANFSIIFTAPSTGWVVGEVVKGGTSNALGRMIVEFTGAIAIEVLSGVFEVGEVVTGQSSGSTGTIDEAFFNAVVQVFKDGIAIVPVGFSSQVAYQFIVGQYELDDDILFNAGTTNTGEFWPTHSVGDYWELTIHQKAVEPDTFEWQIDKGAPSATGVDITGGNQTLSNGVVIKFVSITGHAVGDFWDIEVNQSVTTAWINFYYSVPERKPGEGALIKLPSNFWTMKPQEEQMYINTQNGKWGMVDFILSSNLTNEKVDYTPLKQASQNKVIFPYMIASIDNKLVYITENKTLDMIGRMEFLDKPQIESISDPVKYDLLAASFIDGSIEFWDKKIFITSPQDPIAFCYDWAKKYWQPPQVFPEAALLSIVGDNLIAHSNTRNQTNKLFVGTDDNGSAFTSTISLAYNDYGDQWQSKVWTMDFIEGYVIGAPQLEFSVLQNIGGCGGIKKHTVTPKTCIPKNLASFGKGSFGSHGFGNDPATPVTFFQEIYKHPPAGGEFYYAKIEVTCSTLNQQWGILSLGLNAVDSNSGNNKLVSNNIIIQ